MAIIRSASLLAAVLLGAAALASASGCTTNTDFDYLVFVQQWGPTQGGVCAGNNTQFSIHGLWPSNSGSQQPCYCTSDSFDPSQISDLIPTMAGVWASCDSTDDSFWSHEYEKHGTCCSAMNGFGTEHQFFSNVLALYNKFDLYSALNNAGITPSDSNTYDATSFQNALQSAFGYDSVIECTNGNLDSISLCMDPNLNAITCPSYSSSCAGGLVWPSD